MQFTVDLSTGNISFFVILCFLLTWLFRYLYVVFSNCFEKFCNEYYSVKNALVKKENDGGCMDFQKKINCTRAAPELLPFMKPCDDTIEYKNLHSDNGFMAKLNLARDIPTEKINYKNAKKGKKCNEIKEQINRMKDRRENLRQAREAREMLKKTERVVEQCDKTEVNVLPSSSLVILNMMKDICEKLRQVREESVKLKEQESITSTLGNMFNHIREQKKEQSEENQEEKQTYGQASHLPRVHVIDLGELLKNKNINSVTDILRHLSEQNQEEPTEEPTEEPSEESKEEPAEETTEKSTEEPPKRVEPFTFGDFMLKLSEKINGDKKEESKEESTKLPKATIGDFLKTLFELKKKPTEEPSEESKEEPVEESKEEQPKKSDNNDPEEDIMCLD